MIPQIKNLGKQYSEWVNKPVDRPLLLLGPSLDMLTKTPWWVIPLFWIPAISYIISLGWADGTIDGYHSATLAMTILFGIGLWTLTEYTLHRYVFHLNTDSGNAFKITFHFLIHGLHHKVSLKLNLNNIPSNKSYNISGTIRSISTCVSSCSCCDPCHGFLSTDLRHFSVAKAYPKRWFNWLLNL